MTCCEHCKYLFRDDSVGYFECTKEDDFTDEEFEKYEETGYVDDCPYFEEDSDDMASEMYLDMLNLYNDVN